MKKWVMLIMVMFFLVKEPTPAFAQGQGGQNNFTISALRAIGLGLGAIILVISIMRLWLWLMEARSFKRQNLALVVKLKHDFQKMEVVLPRVYESIIKLKEIQDESVWIKLKIDFESIDFENVKDGLWDVEWESKKSIFNRKTAYELIDSLRQEMDRIEMVFKDINEMPGRILKAQICVNEKLVEICKTIEEMDVLVAREGIPDRTKKWYEKAKLGFLEIKKEFDLLEPKQTDWIEFSHLFIKKYNLIRAARQEIRI